MCSIQPNNLPIFIQGVSYYSDNTSIDYLTIAANPSIEETQRVWNLTSQGSFTTDEAIIRLDFTNADRVCSLYDISFEDALNGTLIMHNQTLSAKCYMTYKEIGNLIFELRIRTKSLHTEKKKHSFYFNVQIKDATTKNSSQFPWPNTRYFGSGDWKDPSKSVTFAIPAIYTSASSGFLYSDILKSLSSQAYNYKYFTVPPNFIADAINILKKNINIIYIDPTITLNPNGEINPTNPPPVNWYKDDLSKELAATLQIIISSNLYNKVIFVVDYNLSNIYKWLSNNIDKYNVIGNFSSPGSNFISLQDYTSTSISINGIFNVTANGNFLNSNNCRPETLFSSLDVGSGVCSPLVPINFQSTSSNPYKNFSIIANNISNGHINPYLLIPKYQIDIIFLYDNINNLLYPPINLCGPDIITFANTLTCLNSSVVNLLGSSQSNIYIPCLFAYVFKQLKTKKYFSKLIYAIRQSPFANDLFIPVTIMNGNPYVQSNDCPGYLNNSSASMPLYTDKIWNPLGGLGAPTNITSNPNNGMTWYALFDTFETLFPIQSNNLYVLSSCAIVESLNYLSFLPSNIRDCPIKGDTEKLNIPSPWQNKPVFAPFNLFSGITISGTDTIIKKGSIITLSNKILDLILVVTNNNVELLPFGINYDNRDKWRINFFFPSSTTDTISNFDFIILQSVSTDLYLTVSNDTGELILTQAPLTTNSQFTIEPWLNLPVPNNIPVGASGATIPPNVDVSYMVNITNQNSTSILNMSNGTFSAVSPTKETLVPQWVLLPILTTQYETVLNTETAYCIYNVKEQQFMFINDSLQLTSKKITPTTVGTDGLGFIFHLWSVNNDQDPAPPGSSLFNTNTYVIENRPLVVSNPPYRFITIYSILPLDNGNTTVALSIKNNQLTLFNVPNDDFNKYLADITLCAWLLHPDLIIGNNGDGVVFSIPNGKINFNGNIVTKATALAYNQLGPDGGHSPSRADVVVTSGNAVIQQDVDGQNVRTAFISVTNTSSSDYSPLYNGNIGSIYIRNVSSTAPTPQFSEWSIVCSGNGWQPNMDSEFPPPLSVSPWRPFLSNLIFLFPSTGINYLYYNAPIVVETLSQVEAIKGQYLSFQPDQKYTPRMTPLITLSNGERWTQVLIVPIFG